MSVKFFQKYASVAVFIAMALLLSACNGGGGTSGTGALSLRVTDLPVTEDVAVCLHFTSITLHHSDGDLIEIDYDPRTYTDATDCIDNKPASDPLSANNAVNINALQGELSVQLMGSQQVKAGHYNWIRLNVDETLSYVMDSVGHKSLTCPSCMQSGLKLNRGFTVPVGGKADFMIDINLGKSLNKDLSGNYRLRPTLRLVNLAQTGRIAGTVDPSLIPGMISATDTGCKVYVYEGHGVVPDDVHDGDNVLTSAKVLYNATTTTYGYAAAFLPTASTTIPTPYTVALTCDFDDVDLDQNNDPTTPTPNDVLFTDGVTEATGQNADVFTDKTTTVPFPPPVV